MTQQVEVLAAELRESVGKGSARATRRLARVPAVIYGNKQPPLSISLDMNQLLRHVYKSGFHTNLFDVEIAGKKHRVLPRDVQYDAVSDRPLHVDFLRVTATTQVRVEIPVVFLDMEKSPGLKRGGTLNIVHHEIEVTCAPGNIPQQFEVSIGEMNIGDAVHMGMIKMPEGMKPTSTEKDFTIASIAAPSAVRSAEDAAATEAAAAPAAGAAAAPAAGAKAAAPAKPAAAKK